MRKLILLFMVLLILCCKSGGEIGSKKNAIHIIILNDGSEYKGKLLKIEKNKVFFVIKGKIREFNKEEVKKIQFKQERMFEEFENINEIKDPDINFIWKKSKEVNRANNENIAILLNKKEIVIDENLNYKMNIKIGFKILNEEGKEESTQYFYYNKLFSNARLLYGITVSKNGSLSFVEEEAINDEPIYNRDPQYDILHRIKFGLKDSEVGADHIWEAEIKGKFDYLENPFFLEEDLVQEEYVEKKVITISYPSNINLKYNIYEGLIPFNKPEIKVNSNINTNKLYMELNQISPFIDDEYNTPDIDKILPAIMFSFNDEWQNLSKIYYEKYFSTKISENIKRFGEKIIGRENDKEKIVKLLYDYINRKIDYSNISFKNSRYVPLSEDRILQFNSLNALDKSFLFTRLCNIYDIESYILFYKYSTHKTLMKDLPNLKQFDSVLCMVNINGEKRILSFENSNFSIYQKNLESNNAFALPISNSDLFKLSSFSLDDNITEQKYICELKEDNSLKVKRITIIKGIDEKNIRHLRLLSKEELDKYIISRLNSISEDINLINYNFVNNLSDFDNNIYLEENFIVNNFSLTSGANIKLFNIPGFNYKANNVVKDKRKLPFYVDYIGKIKISIDITIPDKYKVSFVPEPIIDIFNDIEFRANFSVEKRNIKFNSEIVYKNPEIDIENYKDIKKVFEDRAILSKEWIMIEK